uniref:Putative acetyl transferase n=1 Tax=Stigmatella aurantiaca TaxID=41 RepID=Q93TW5_STIAU|nr:putative acetyl transferase [Stigmatella aurantiaca]
MRKWLVAFWIGATVALTGCSDEPGPLDDPPVLVDHWLTASDGMKLHYLELEGEGTPVVLLHGFLGTASGTWVAPGFAQALAAAGHRVILLDQRGHGESDKPLEPSAYGEQMVTDVIEMLDDLKINQAHVGGYSMGGEMTAMLMRRVPERFITAHLGGAGIVETDEALRAAAAALDPKGTDPEEPRILALFEEATANLPPPDPRVIAAMTEAWAVWGPRPVDLTVIDFPVLTVNGEFDNPYSKTLRMTRELSQFENVVVPRRSHLTTLIDPLYLQSLVAFIDTHDPR